MLPAYSLDSFGYAARTIDMVVFDQNHIIQPLTVILTASYSNCIFI